jgi:glycine cleavage system T protein (aminomethyltransferase)
MTDAGLLKELPLKDLHEEAGARFAPFAGWSMPVSYPLGVMKEHLHTRAQAGLFDISHMQLFAVTGPDAATLIEKVCPLEASTQATGGSKYTFLLNENAGIIDDVIVTRLSDSRFMIVANASRAEADAAWIRMHAKGLKVAIDRLDRVFLALQGPRAMAVMEDAGVDTGGMTFMSGHEPSTGWFVTRSGYTGEDGFEIAMPAAEAKDFAKKIAGDNRVRWIGLAARDSLRLEAGLCLYGSDLDETTDLASAGLIWAIAKTLRTGGPYAGATKLAQIIADGPVERRVGLQAEGRQPVRGGAILTDAEGNPAGRVTSGGFGPSVNHPVAMGYVLSALSEPRTELFADVRGKPVSMRVTKLPFITKRSKKG